MNIVGRSAEMRELQRYYDSGRPEFVVVYGRRRVGKTYLIREYFQGKFAFYFSGTVNSGNAATLKNFDKAIIEHGGKHEATSKDWGDAFGKLKKLLQKSSTGRQIIFIDEMPWLDARGSDFLVAFDYFWNIWASANPDILLICCGSATSWITKNIFQNKGGLHNRVTGRIHLAPFTLGECEEFFKTRGVEITRYQMVECYMIFGGIPYYLNLFEKGSSFPQNVDRLCYADSAPLKHEYEELYRSLFSAPQRHISIVEALAGKNSGLSRNEISEMAGIPPNGHLTKTLNELEQCDFIEKYTDFTKRKNDAYYYLKDPFTLFYLRYMKNNDTKDEYFWTNYAEDGGHRAWSGYAFEQVCRMHIRQLKEKLGILGVSTRVMSWRSKDCASGAQIDLLIDRNDGVINLCEMKYLKHPYEISKSEAGTLEHKKSVFLMETGTRSAIHITIVTTFGLAKTGYRGMAQSEVVMADLFR